MFKEIKYMLITLLKCLIAVGVVALAAFIYVQVIKKDPQISSNKQVILNAQKKVDAYLEKHGYNGFTSTNPDTTIFKLIPELKGMKYSNGHRLINPDYIKLPSPNVAKRAAYICPLRILDDPETKYISESDYYLYIKNPDYTMTVVKDGTKNNFKVIKMNTSFFSMSPDDTSSSSGVEGYVKAKDLLTDKYTKYGLNKN